MTAMQASLPETTLEQFSGNKQPAQGPIASNPTTTTGTGTRLIRRVKGQIATAMANTCMYQIVILP